MEQSLSAPEPTVFLVGTLIDATGSDPIRDAMVVTERGRIVQVGPAKSLRHQRRHHRVVDASEATMMPGLIDSHCHVFYLNSEDFGQPVGVSLIASGLKNALNLLMQGVTTARELCTRDNLDVELRDAIARGLVVGPRLFVSGEGMAMTGGKARGMVELVTEITGPDEARRFVRRQVRSGVDLIKVFATAGLTDGGQEQLTELEIRAAVEEAHKAGRSVAAHAIGTAGIKNAVRAGADTVEHGTFLDEEAVHLMLATGTALVPTLSIGHTMAEQGAALVSSAALIENAKQALAREADSARMAYQAGIPIGAGTDPVYGDTMAMECRQLLQVGLDPMQTLQAATIVGARILGQEAVLGTIEPGKYADLLLVDGNPLDDVAALERVRYVVKAGVTVRAAA